MKEELWPCFESWN